MAKNKICPLYSTWRMILFPFYSIYEVVWFLLLESFLAVICYAIFGYVPVVPLMAGFLGWTMISKTTAPSETTAYASERFYIEQALIRLNYQCDSNHEYWCVKAPRFIVWNYSSVSIIEDEDMLEVNGPRNILRRVFAGLR